MARIRSFPATRFVERFAEQTVPGFGQLRRQAMEDLGQIGIPSRFVEQWKWSDMRRFAQNDLAIALPCPDFIPPEKAGIFQDFPCWRLIWVNGYFRADLSDMPAHRGLQITPLHEFLAKDSQENIFSAPPFPYCQPFDAINTAFMRDGAVITVAPNAKIDRPVRLINLTTGDDGEQYMRFALRLGEGAFLQISSEYETNNGHCTNIGWEIALGAKASLCHLQAVNLGKKASHIESLRLDMAQKARYDGYFLSEGKGFLRRDAYFRLGGEGSTLNLAGACLPQDKGHIDNTLYIDHDNFDTVSSIVFKAALPQQTRNIFQGKIHVRRSAQKTDAKEMINSLLLSEKSSQHAKPELEIYADDVRCGHGATIGQLDEQALFYLRARGLPVQEARKLLIHAFLSETIEMLSTKIWREIIEERIAAWLAQVSLAEEKEVKTHVS